MMGARPQGCGGVLVPISGNSTGEDPYLWLEDVDGADALAWVEERNRATRAALAEDSGFVSLLERLRALFDAEDRIPWVRKRGDWYYNFQQDAEHPRGLWRRTTLEEYRNPAPDWEVVLDLDALGRAEGERWVFAGAEVLVPSHDRALLRLSRGGADAVVVREFDLVARSFVEGGFSLPEAKAEVSWAGPDEILVGTDFGLGSMTDSGYPRIVKRWRRGQALDEAATVFEGEVLDNVRARVEVATPAAGGRTFAPLPGVDSGAGFRSIVADAVDAHADDWYFLTSEDYLTPPALALASVGEAPVVLKRMPARFDAEGLAVAQHWATSADGTPIPYFEVSRHGAAAAGPRPTLLRGYGGFEVSETPWYAPAVGAAWLEPGGVFSVANIRGGGEFGPAWHRAAVRSGRRRAGEDFIAVAEDLVRRGVSTPNRLGIIGASNGGLLMGNMLTMRPDLFGAIVAQVPLFDMRRYHRLLAGASWVAEFGDPDDPGDWAFMREFSPYHNVEAGVDYPKLLITTSTRDDRVHPGHARKMAAKMQAMGHEVLYHENVEGGHAGAARQRRARVPVGARLPLPVGGARRRLIRDTDQPLGSRLLRLSGDMHRAAPCPWIPSNITPRFST